MFVSKRSLTSEKRACRSVHKSLQIDCVIAAPTTENPMPNQSTRVLSIISSLLPHSLVFCFSFPELRVLEQLLVHKPFPSIWIRFFRTLYKFIDNVTRDYKMYKFCILFFFQKIFIHFQVRITQAHQPRCTILLSLKRCILV